MARLSLRAFPHTEHHHVLNIHKSSVFLLSFDQSFQHAAIGKQIQGSCLLVFVAGQPKSWTVFKISALNDPLHQV